LFFFVCLFYVCLRVFLFLFFDGRGGGGGWSLYFIHRRDTLALKLSEVFVCVVFLCL